MDMAISSLNLVIVIVLQDLGSEEDRRSRLRDSGRRLQIGGCRQISASPSKPREEATQTHTPLRSVA